MGNPTLDGNVIYGCDNIRYEEQGNILPFSMPTLGSSSTEVYDMLGVIRMITVTGIFADDYGGTSADTKANTFMDLVTGDQSTVTFVDHNGNSYSVMIANVAISWDIPGFKCDYEIKLIRGTN